MDKLREGRKENRKKRLQNHISVSLSKSTQRNKLNNVYLNIFTGENICMVYITKITTLKKKQIYK